MTQTVLILGASGRLGRALVQAFCHAGWQVLAQSRKPLPMSVGQSIKHLNTDALAVAELLQMARQQGPVDVVINALNAPYTNWGTMALPLSDAALTLAQGLSAMLMLPGNIYNFGRELPVLLREGVAQNADHLRAKIRKQMEQDMADSSANTVVLRAGDYFGGQGGGSWFDMAVVKDIQKGKVVYPGPTDLAHAWAYVPDFARCFVAVAEKRASLQGHHDLHFSGHTLSGQQLHAALELTQGRGLKLGSLPWGLFRALAPVVPLMRAFVDMRYLWQRPHQLDNTGLINLIGAEPHTPLKLALQEILGRQGTPAKPAQPQNM